MNIPSRFVNILISYEARVDASVLPCNYNMNRETLCLHVLIVYVLITNLSVLPCNHIDQEETRTPA